MKSYKVATFFSGFECSQKNSKYNLRQDECKAVVYALMGHGGFANTSYVMCRMRDLTCIKINCWSFGANALSIITCEYVRVERGVILWGNGDLEGYGRLVFESGNFLYIVMNADGGGNFSKEKL